MKLFCVESFCSTLYINVENIHYVETPTPKGKPAGWPDGFAALVYFRDINAQQTALLNAEQWRQLQVVLGIDCDKPIIVPTGATYEAVVGPLSVDVSDMPIAWKAE